MKEVNFSSVGYNDMNFW